MVFQPSKAFLRRWFPGARSAQQTSKTSGFTLIEVLVAALIGSLITGTLLYLVVELMKINRREDLLTQTQQDMQRAIDYITRDASEAIFVYADPAAITAEITNPPADSVPILAFWRLDPLSKTELDALEKVNCATVGATSGDTAETNQARCSTLKIRQSTYTLVIYYHSDNAKNAAGSIWRGPARIIRYELSQYQNLTTGFSQTEGYDDPSLNERFATWKRDEKDKDTKGISAVLADFVDTGTAVDPKTACPTPPPEAVYTVTDKAPNSFYTCTLDGDVDAEDLTLTTRANQSMRVYLRGNASIGRFGLTGYSEKGKLPALESEILVRGVIQRQPGS